MSYPTRLDAKSPSPMQFNNFFLPMFKYFRCWLYTITKCHSQNHASGSEVLGCGRARTDVPVPARCLKKSLHGDAIISTRYRARALKFFMAATSLFRTASHQGVWKEQKARTRRVSVYSRQEPSLLSTRVDSAFSAFHGCSLEGSPFSRQKTEEARGHSQFILREASRRALLPGNKAAQEIELRTIRLTNPASLNPSIYFQCCWMETCIYF